MQGNFDINVSISDISKRKDIINKHTDDLCSMIKKYQNMINETKEYYDTPSSNIFRLIASRYIDVVLLYINNDFKEYVNKLDVVTSSYGDFLKNTKRTVEVSDNHEI